MKIMESASYILRHQARCMVALEGEKEKDCFLVGTVSLRGVRDIPRGKQTPETTPFLPPNDVQLLEFNEDNGEVSEN